MEKYFWLKSYETGIPAHIDYPSKSLPQVFDDTVKKFPNNIAMIFRDVRLTYGYMSGLIDRFAAALHEIGIRKGERVALMAPNCPQWEIAFYGILKAGAIVVQTNPMYMERELEYQINDAEAESIVVFDALYPRVAQIRPRSKLRHVIIISMDNQGIPVEGVHYFEEMVKRAHANVPGIDIDPQKDVAVLQYTGGTTGVPKGVMLTHHNLVANALMIRHWLKDCEEGKERVLTVLPLFHVYAMTICMNFSVLVGAAQIILPRFDIDHVLKAINDFAPTCFPGAPTMYIAFNNHPRLKEYRISSIKWCISGSAPLPVEVAQKFQELTGGQLVEGYGLSEASPVTHCNPLNGKAKPGSIGLSFPDTLSKIMDIATGSTELEVGQIGELVVKGPQVMTGYWRRPEETAEVLRDGWLYTGDIARMDNDGFVYIVDRKKDMIIAGGYNIYPREIEDVLFEHPAVREAAVVGVTDLYRGETVKAFVVLQPGAVVNEAVIISFCRQRMAAFKVPHIIEFCDSLPKTAVGKILRRVLAEQELQRVAKGEPRK